MALLIQRTEHQIERMEKVESDLEPVKIHVNKVTGIIAFVLSAGAVVALAKLLW